MQRSKRIETPPVDVDADETKSCIPYWGAMLVNVCYNDNVVTGLLSSFGSFKEVGTEKPVGGDKK